MRVISASGNKADLICVRRVAGAIDRSVAFSTRRAKHLLFYRNVSSHLRKNKYLCEKPKQSYIPRHPALSTEGVSLSLRHVARGAMDAQLTHSGRRTRVRPSRVVLIPRRWDQVALAIARRRGPKSPEPRGEHGVSRKAIAQGKPGCPVVPVVPAHVLRRMGCPCAPARGIYGCPRRPAFPAPSDFTEDANFPPSLSSFGGTSASLGRICAARLRRRVLALFEN